MQGILIVDKPTDWTSFDVIAKLRGVLGTRKLGHSGTLDPMATGVLPVFCGGASKAVDLQVNHNKTYCATLTASAFARWATWTPVPLPAVWAAAVTAVPRAASWRAIWTTPRMPFWQRWRP